MPKKRAGETATLGRVLSNKYGMGMVEVKCDHCGCAVMTAFGHALCRPCYDIHYEGLLTKSRVRNEDDDGKWRAWLAAVQGGNSDALEEVEIEKLAQKCHDKSGIRQLAYRVRAKRQGEATRTTTKRRSSKTDSAVFR